jgi:GTP pyrophosphokinase
VFTREHINVIAVNTLSRADVASMRFTVEIRELGQLGRLLKELGGVSGVRVAYRR